METITLQWQKRNDYPFWRWCQFNLDLLDDPRLESHLETSYGALSTKISGVYVIWAGLTERTILKVGSGIIKDRFRAHRNDPKIQAYRYRGLYATWAPILFVDNPKEKREGVERYLGVWLNPKLTERLPNVDPIWVNLPEWDPPVNPFLKAVSQSRHVQPKRLLGQLRNK